MKKCAPCLLYTSVTQLEKTTHTKVNEIQTDMESVHAEIQASLEHISKVIASLEEQKEQDGKDHDQSITEINRVNQSVQEINPVSYTHLDVYKRQ